MRDITEVKLFTIQDCSIDEFPRGILAHHFKKNRPISVQNLVNSLCGIHGDFIQFNMILGLAGC
jgi:hypothetical protein